MTTQREEYEALVERCAKAAYDAANKGRLNCWDWDDPGLEDEHKGTQERFRRHARAILAEVFSTLGTVTERMAREYNEADPMWTAERVIRNVLAASAVTPGGRGVMRPTSA